MAMSEQQRQAVGSVRITGTPTEMAFQLEFNEGEISRLQMESLAIQYRLSRGKDKTVARGESYDLLIETLGFSAKVTRLNHATA